LVTFYQEKVTKPAAGDERNVEKNVELINHV
jgi:hypothetical protein